MARNEQAHGEGPPQAVPDVIPILPLRGCVAYPGLLVPLLVGRPASIAMVEEAVRGDGWLGLAAMHDSEVQDPQFEDLFRVGAAGRIERVVKNDEGQLQVLVQVHERIHLDEALASLPWVLARVSPLPEGPGDESEERALIRRVMRQFQELVELVPSLSGEVFNAVMAMSENRELVYLLASALPLPLHWRQALLEASPFRSKLELVLEQLDAELELARLGASLHQRVSEKINQQNKEFFLREQLRMIEEELAESPAGGGAGDPDEEAPLRALREHLEAGRLPEEAAREARRELKRLKAIPPGSPERGQIEGYLDWLGRMPWGVTTGETPDVAAARSILERDHAGLHKVKERLLEYLAVRRLRAQRGLPTDDSRVREPILCLVGPPGVGKTSLGRSVALALGRKFVRVSLGGVHDEAAIRGHRRTYIGAMPGRIVQALARAGSLDPVIMLDELDKVGADYRGDPASALLELLDPEQNAGFRDHFLDVPFDLSKAVVIATANTLETVPPALRDRLEIIQLPGYTEDEKLTIGRKFLLPRQLVSHGLAASDVRFEDEALLAVIREHTREAGVRELERQLATLCRKAAVEVAEGHAGLLVDAAAVTRHLGPARHTSELQERIDRPGVATGLVWTPVGGEILFVEAAVMPGRKVLKLTGQLGDVMRESAEAALSYLRSRAGDLGLEPRFFEAIDIHLHVPGGAIPKDGPSAGITLSVAMLSALTGRPVRDDLAMTGEITLRGKVLPVGGIKEKVLGAHRAGVKAVMLPRRNMVDLEELPAELRAEMRFIPVDSVDDVWRAAFESDAPIAERAERGPEPRIWICRSPLPYGTLVESHNIKKRSRLDADQP